MSKNLKQNASGYSDPTAYEAIMRADKETKEEKKFRSFIGCILRICELSGYHLEERIVVKDKATGKIWR